jgi:hypothetical protein
MARGLQHRRAGIDASRTLSEEAKMNRTLAILAGAAATWLATSSQAAEIVGTLIRSDGPSRTIVVQGDEGRLVTFRTSDATRIRYGDRVVEVLEVPRGTSIQVVSETEPSSVVLPLATGIVVQPASIRIVSETTPAAVVVLSSGGPFSSPTSGAGKVTARQYDRTPAFLSGVVIEDDD